MGVRWSEFLTLRKTQSFMSSVVAGTQPWLTVSRQAMLLFHALPIMARPISSGLLQLKRGRSKCKLVLLVWKKKLKPLEIQRASYLWSHWLALGSTLSMRSIRLAGIKVMTVEKYAFSVMTARSSLQCVAATSSTKSMRRLQIWFSNQWHFSKCTPSD